jgi:wyosine [tRNA(Phe)-imidazoG37] synthetase (radical SAM superfamily)
MKYVYGPVASWRLGRSLGVDILSTAGKTCSFDCIYCQLGRTVNRTTERRVYVPTEAIARELAALAHRIDDIADVVTFAGMGEPTLGANLREVVEVIRSHTSKPVAILTNAALITDEHVRADLQGLDIVVAKLDAPQQRLFELVNRPVSDALQLDAILKGLKTFRRAYHGKLCLQLMFVAANKASAPAMARRAADLAPDEVQLNTPLRPCGVEPLSPEEMHQIAAHFKGMEPQVSLVYEQRKRNAAVLAAKDVLRRRGVRK